MQANKQSQADQSVAHPYHLLRAALNNFGKNPHELSSNELHAARQQALKAFELEQLVLNTPEAHDIVLPNSLVDKSIEDVKARYPTEEEFITDLTANELDMEKLQSAVYRELLVETVLERVASRAADISELDIMLYYYLHKDKFVKPETRSAYHILITLNEDFEENHRAAATERLQQIRKRLLKKPDRFGEQAMKHSECPTALRDGFLGDIPRGELYPELDQVMFSMKQGEISEIVESPVGLHLLYCKEINNAGPVAMKKAQDKIREHLLQRRRRMCQKNWLAGLTEK